MVTSFFKRIEFRSQPDFATIGGMLSPQFTAVIK